MSRVINYSLLSRAIECYSDMGYEQIEVDWMVPEHICVATNAHPSGMFSTVDRNGSGCVLVGSAEQGFLKAIIDDRIEVDRKYMSVSPCFRRGDIGPINQEWFVKLELGAVSYSDRDLFKLMASEAMDVFSELGATVTRLDVSFDGGDSDPLDIVYYQNNAAPMELGSYGYREITDLTPYNFLLHYGTGLALPRFQYIQR